MKTRLPTSHQSTMIDVGEFGFINKLQKQTRHKNGVILGIGDDAAICKAVAGQSWVLTTDMLIEGKHFLRKQASFYEIGKKAMAVNLSDIAAMGATPQYAMVSVGLPGRLLESEAMSLYKGLSCWARRFGFSIVGGDTNHSQKIIVNVALIGTVKEAQAWTRSGARSADDIWVTGALGNSYDSKRHLNFKPRLAEADFLRSHVKVRSMMDVSDGLAGDIVKLCRASGVGCVIDVEKIPVHADCRGVAQALTQGEDFELLFTLRPEESAKLSHVLSQSKTRFTCIGQIRAKKYGILLKRGEKTIPWPARGYDHFL